LLIVSQLLQFSVVSYIVFDRCYMRTEINHQ
jgi:hypothetical protein